MSRRNLLLLCLLVSVGINLFLFGGIAMRMSSVGDLREGRPLPPNVGWIVRDLSPERQQEMLAMMAPLAAEISPLRRSLFQAQREVNQLMAAPDYDASALNQAFAELRQASEAYTALSHQQTLSMLGQLTEEERQAAMEFIQRRGPRDGRDGFRGPGGPGRAGPGDFGGGDRQRPPPPGDAPQL